MPSNPRRQISTTFATRPGLSAATEQIERSTDRRPAEDLERQVRSVLDHAVDAYRRDLKVYQSLQNLNEVIGTEYGGRVLYELIQNAHDAHTPGDEGRIAIELVIHSETEGILYVANGGNGFRREDVEAIRNLAISAKEVGEGIGNKGLGFRSIEALTDDVRIFSRRGTAPTDRFDGYCFRFAEISEIEDILRSYRVDAATSAAVARIVPRYLVPRPLEEPSRLRRGGPPRFVDRLPESVANISEGDGLAELAFGEALGLRDWQSQATAIDRLRDLASIAEGLASNDRPTLRREYQRAWLDVVETGISLPDDLSLIVTRRGQKSSAASRTRTPLRASSSPRTPDGQSVDLETHAPGH